MSADPADYRFGRFVLRHAERQLLIDGEPAPLGARAYDLLTALVQRRDRVVSKDELLELVWPKAVVEENTLQVHISALRKVLGQQAITTIPGRGYRLTVELEQVGSAGPAPSRAQTNQAPAAATVLRGNLPSQLPSLIGRDEDLQVLLAEVKGHPLVTLVGAPGVGKTTLATAAAHAASRQWRDGAWKVELAQVIDPAQLPYAVAQSLGIALNGPGPSQELLVGVLQSRSLLLLLDNCEHLADAAAALAEAIVAHAPGVRILATSQERLNVAIERVIKLNPLEVPSADANPADPERFGAIRLFAERARAADPHFELGSNNAAAVADICRHLDGLPLAIELAAARVRVLGVHGVRDRLGERFRLLTGGARTAMRRHQTLRAAIDWTHALLSEVDKTVFRRLGVFVGGFTMELAQQVAADAKVDEWAVLEALSALVDKSLVTLQDEDAPRYALLETSCAFALEKLVEAGETADVLRRHPAALRTVLEPVYEARYGERGSLTGDAFAARLRPEIDNLRSALAWAARDGPDERHQVALSVLLAEALSADGRSAEGVAVLSACKPRVVAAANLTLATTYWFSVAYVGRDRWPNEADYRAALARAEQGCVDLGWLRRLHRVRVLKAASLMRRSEHETARTLLTEVVALEQPTWPGWIRSDRFNVQANIQIQTGAFELAWSTFETMDALLPPRGEERRRTQLTMNRAVCFNFQGRWGEAVSLLVPLVDEMRLRRRVPEMSAWSHGHLVLALTELGRLTNAHERLREALPMWRADGILSLMIFTAIRLVVAEGRMADALRLLGMEETASRPISLAATLETAVRNESNRLIETAVPDPVQRQRWKSEGAALNEDAAIELCHGRSHRPSE
jgi:predicted ATPase/DNA-binding winged helix-turn-helix (wHTH) protein